MQTQLQKLRNSDLHRATLEHAAHERKITLTVLWHLREIERRKLFCDFGCRSLFEYAVKELKYSEGAASRRVQAMRLLVEMPEIESKIETGELSLTNISQAQSYFRDLRQAEPARVIRAEEKKELLAKLESKSSREAEKVLLALTPPEVMPCERIRQVTAELAEARVLISEELKSKLDTVRSLLGPKGASLSLADLMLEMAKLSAERLSEKRFGKARVRAAASEAEETAPSPANPGAGVESASASHRYIPRAVKHQVWLEAKGKCQSCGSQHHLQYDHIQPVALGGSSSAENLQLLCRSCNLRRGIRTFGTSAMNRRADGLKSIPR